MRRELKGFGRIAAQAAKQVILQKVRDAERDSIYEYYQDKVGDVVNGIVTRIDRGNLYVDLGKAEAILPRSEQVPRDNYSPGERIRAYLLEVRKGVQGAQVVLSRGHPGLLAKLFQMEVPEIYDGIVEIKAAVREPGGRAKLAVSSNERNVDPVGACVGMKGSRVQAIVRELRGENIDIVEYSSDLAKFIANAISPAMPRRVVINEEEHSVDVLVPDDQLSLAIGKRGQNVRLAAKLTGWKIDIKSDSEVAMEERLRLDRIDDLQEELAMLDSIDPDLAERLVDVGLFSLRGLVNLDVSDLASALELPEEVAGRILDGARKLYTT
jgi:N utilization substance protein A